MVSRPFLFGADPFADLRRMQRDMGRLFASMDGRAEPQFPAVNLWAGDAGVAVTMELPGLSADDIDITVRDDRLTIAGERKADAPEGAAWLRRERAHGRFSRSVRLPFRVDGDKVEARVRNGVLEIALERPDADKPRKISISAA